MSATEPTPEQGCMPAQPTDEHAWLRHMVGEWRIESECLGVPGMPPFKSTGSETARMLGDLWLVADGRGEMPDGAVGSWRLALGFDPGRGKFVGSWVGSMMTSMFVYEGLLDPDGRALPLMTEGPSFAGDGATAPYRDSYERVSDDERVLRSACLGPDGRWTEFMVARYRRVR